MPRVINNPDFTLTLTLTLPLPLTLTPTLIIPTMSCCVLDNNPDFTLTLIGRRRSLRRRQDRRGAAGAGH